MDITTHNPATLRTPRLATQGLPQTHGRNNVSNSLKHCAPHQAPPPPKRTRPRAVMSSVPEVRQHATRFRCSEDRIVVRYGLVKVQFSQTLLRQLSQRKNTLHIRSVGPVGGQGHQEGLWVILPRWPGSHTDATCTTAPSVRNGEVGGHWTARHAASRAHPPNGEGWHGNSVHNNPQPPKHNWARRNNAPSPRSHRRSEPRCYEGQRGPTKGDMLASIRHPAPLVGPGTGVGLNARQASNPMSRHAGARPTPGNEDPRGRADCQPACKSGIVPS